MSKTILSNEYGSAPIGGAAQALQFEIVAAENNHSVSENPTVPETQEVSEQPEAAPITIEYVAVDSLRAHPENLRIYGQPSFPEELRASVEANGITTPLVVNTENQIISGHHRWEVAKSLSYLEVPIIRREFEFPEDEITEIIHSNVQRQTTEIQKLRSYEALLAIEVEKARRRQQAGGVPENLPEGERGEARNLAAKLFGRSGRTMSDGLKALHLAENLDASHKNEVLKLLNTGKYKPALIEAEKFEQLQTTEYPDLEEDFLSQEPLANEAEQRIQLAQAAIAALKDAVDAVMEIEFEQFTEAKQREIKRLIGMLAQRISCSLQPIVQVATSSSEATIGETELVEAVETTE